LAHRRICAVLLCWLFASLACAAPEAPSRYGLSIPAGLPLDQALQELARQTGVQLVFFSQITAGRTAPPLSGEYTLTDALTRLLDGADLTFRQVNARTVEVRRAPPSSTRSGHQVQPPTPVGSDPMQEVRVVATVEQLVATRIPTPLNQIPQSLSVISDEQIRQQNAFELSDVMLNTPGIALRRGSSVDQRAYSRAFEITSYHVEGGGALKPSMTNLSLYEDNPDLSEFDRVEVLRGSDALFASNSDPGGTVSLVRKRPLATPSFQMSATLGSWNNYRVELDATGPLTDDGALRGRADVVYADRDFFFDRAHQQRKKIFGALEYDFSPTSTLTAGGTYQWDDALPVASGLPLYVDGSDPHFPRSTGLTFDWAFYNTRESLVYAQYRQQFADNWSLRLNTSAGRTIVEYGVGEFGPWTDKVTQSLGAPSATFTTRPNRFTMGTVDATLTGKLDWFGLRETIAVGGDFTRVRGYTAGDIYLGIGPALTNVATFDPAVYANPRGILKPTLGLDAREVLEQYGGFVSLQVDVNDALSLTGGARVASDSLRLAGNVFIGGFEFTGLTNEWSSARIVQPFAALRYRISDHFSAYASYADIYRTLQGPRSSDGKEIGPAHGVNFEAGIKGVWRDGALNGSLAVYRIEQRHMPVRTAEPATSGNCCFVNGTGRSRGVELEVDGELAPGWLIGSGYTYNLYDTADGIIPVTSTPRHLLKIWTSATLPGALYRWTVGGSLRAQTPSRGSRVFVCDPVAGVCPQREVGALRPYAVLDLRAGFEIDPTWQAALSVNNVFDKRYYLSQDTPNLNVWYGEPRNLMLRIDAKY
jgi:outer membrane receptor for ferric coprogen and ferric-rhodotorulic acid